MSQREPPQCKCCLPATLRTVRKEGPTYGRQFYGCSRFPATGACKFFEWVSGGGSQPTSATPSPAAAFGGSPSQAQYSQQQRQQQAYNSPHQQYQQQPAVPQSFATPPRPGPTANAAAPYSQRQHNFQQRMPQGFQGGPASSPGQQQQQRTPLSQGEVVPVDLQMVDETTFGAGFPYNEALKDYVKHLPRPIGPARWEPSRRLWTFPMAQYDGVLQALQEGPPVPTRVNPIPPAAMQRFSQDPLEGSSAGRQQHRASESEVAERLARLPADLWARLYAFQQAGVRYGIERLGRCLLGDEMGLGKTVQALGIAAAYAPEDWPLLIICPSTMKLVWVEAVGTWLPPALRPQPGDLVVITDAKSAADKLAHLAASPAAAKVVVVTYDQVKKVDGALRALRPQMVIADESHQLKGLSTQRTLAVGAQVRAARRAVLVSGTPALSRPIELFPQVDMLCPGLLGSLDDFGMRYCGGKPAAMFRYATSPNGMDYRGASCLPELQALLEREVVVRRTKAQVLAELPDKVRKRVPVEADPAHAARLEEARAQLEEVEMEAGAGRLSAEEADAQRQQLMGELYRRTGPAKVLQVAAHATALLDAGHKLLIFAHHKEVLDALQQALFPGDEEGGAAQGGGASGSKRRQRGGGGAVDGSGRRCVRIDGAVTNERRKAAMDAFQGEQSVRAALLSITAAGLGLTLTAATVVLFAELWWTPGSLIQAEDRAHRLGQRAALEVHYLTAANTADDVIWRTVGSKLGVVSSVLGDADRPAAAGGGSGGGSNAFLDLRFAARYENVQQRLAEEAAAAAGAVPLGGGGSQGEPSPAPQRRRVAHLPEDLSEAVTEEREGGDSEEEDGEVVDLTDEREREREGEVNGAS